MNKTLLISVCLFLSASVLCHADGPELPADSITSAPDSIDAQITMRLNPEIYDDCRTGSFPGGARPDYSEYTFLQQDAGHIELNGADWSQLSERFAAAQRGEALFPVVYLGDSHVQADFGGAILRSRLAEVAGSAGRGIIIPYRLASTNEPGDYSFRLAEDYVASKLMKMPWAT
ncbi:MAG: hypothetical protein K2F63_00365, partial [Muribaculaceae bacterium]|nr:hypothetical protein [Muribaculaceae bacterium]